MIKICGCLSIIFMLFSCVSQRKVEYFQNKSDANSINNYSNKLQENVIQSGDELYIRVSSLDQDNYNFMTIRQEGLGMLGNQGISLFSYTVSPSGSVILPVIGAIPLQGLTLSQAGLKIQDSLVNYLNRPTVVVKMVNRTVTVLGLVRIPGKYDFTHERMNIIQAIGQAGDITEYGDRKNVILVREDNQKIKQLSIDLTDTDLFISPYYYLKPGDIVYIKPLKARFWGINSVPFTLILSSITTTVLLLNYLNN